jgi:hypothetical protein
MLPFGELGQLVEYKTKDPAHGDNRTLTEDGKHMLKRYHTGKLLLYAMFLTKKEPLLRTRTNLLLSTDLVSGESSDFIRKLRAAIKWQTPKWQGKVYVGTGQSALEVFMMAFKNHFQIPSFIAASIDPHVLIEHWSKKGEDGYNQNLIYEIDLSNFPNYSTIVDDDHCLLTCYNNFRWEGYRLVPAKIDGQDVNVPVITLTVEGSYDPKEFDADGKPVPRPSLDWINKSDNELVSCDVDSRIFNAKLKELCDAYNTHHATDFPMPWLNADFDHTNSSPFAKEGKVIHGKEFALIDSTPYQSKERLIQ